MVRALPGELPGRPTFCTLETNIAYGIVYVKYLNRINAWWGGGYLFKPLLVVHVGLQFELLAGVGPIHQEQPLLWVQLLHQYGRLPVVAHLQKEQDSTISLKVWSLLPVCIHSGWSSRAQPLWLLKITWD